MLALTVTLLAALDGGVVEQSVDAGVDDAGVAVDAGLSLDAPELNAVATDEEAPSAEEVEELDAVHAIEAATLDPSTRGAAAMRLTLNQLPYGSLERDRLELALERAELQGEPLPALEPITDLSTFDIATVKDRYDIPIEMKPLVEQYIHFFQGAGRKWFRRWMARSYRFIPLMQPILEERGLPRDTVYLSMIESGFNTQAKSWARAVGPWQFIAGTAKLFNLKEDFWIDERRDPVKATYAASDFLSLLYSKLGHWYLAWAGYNTGGARVRWLIEKHGTRDFWELSTKRHGLAKETQHYVPKLIACALVAKNPEAFGFTPDEFEPEPLFEFDEVKLTDAVDLEVLANAAGVDVEVIKELNPELKRWCTPPASEEKPYTVRIPKGGSAAFAEAFAKYAPEERLKFTIHKVGKGDTLSKVAAKYHSAPEAIMRMNGLESAKALKLGMELAVPVPMANSGKVADAALEVQVARARRSGFKAVKPEEEVPAGAGAVSVKTAKGGAVTVDSSAGKKVVQYAVARGDSLWSIARRFDVHVQELREWNESLGSSRGLKVGQLLTIHPGAEADLTGARAEAPVAAKPVAERAPAKPVVAEKKAAPEAKSGAHTVQSGDSLWSISKKYAVSVDDLKAWNKLGSTKLKRGQKLVVAAP